MAGDSLPTATDLSFLQISDSHIGFSKEADKDVTVTFRIALDRINVLPTPPSFLIHTGGITQLTKPEEFDTFGELLKSCRTKDVFYGPLKVPAEKLRSMFGLTSVQYLQGKSSLAVVDSNLS
jgi:3',5'-cyclic AMP phosphodiesterase CpdA